MSSKDFANDKQKSSGRFGYFLDMTHPIVEGQLSTTILSFRRRPRTEGMASRKGNNLSSSSPTLMVKKRT